MDIPEKESPAKRRSLAPKSLFTEQFKYVFPKRNRTSSKNVSPEKQAMRPVLPSRGSVGSSPTKTTALMLKRKATLVCQRRSPVKIPKRPTITSKEPAFHLPGPLANSQDIIEEKLTGECDKASLSQEEDAEETDKDDEDQLQLMDLMAACTTIRYDPKKGTANQDNDTKSKSQRRRNMFLSLLEEDILEADPKKDERDTEYAKDFFNRVKQALKDDPQGFEQFLVCLHETNKEDGDPVKLYSEVATILHDKQELLDDFAAFLLGHQAVECGCFVPYLQYQQLREFLRKLEIYCCDYSTYTFQGTLRKLSKWLMNSQDVAPCAFLKHIPSIMIEMLDYFMDKPVPESYIQDEEFEECDLEAVVDKDNGFEELVLPVRRETYNTRLCACNCHWETDDENYKKRTTHCLSCSLMLKDGSPVVMISRYEYRPLTIFYPHEERERLKKAKREAAQLALAKAKAQCSNSKGIKTKRSSSHSQNAKTKGLVCKRKRRKRVQKGAKRKTNSAHETGALTVNLKFNKPVKVEEKEESLDFVPVGVMITNPVADTSIPDFCATVDILSLNSDT